MQEGATTVFLDIKLHYGLLGGLRGVAALMAIRYHIFEGLATSPIGQRSNHGYLAIDFLFILPGFVVGYAYDDRWKTMRTKNFFKRRLIRLHPIAILGAVSGSITFCIQDCEKWDGSQVFISTVMLAMLMGMFLVPAVPGAGPEVHKSGEAYPLNGPSWSSFSEYIENILYALFTRKLSTEALMVLVILVRTGLVSSAIFNFSGYGHLGVGWSMADYNLIGGFPCLLFLFFIGLLMTCAFKPPQVRGAFWIYSLAIIVLSSMPCIGGGEFPQMNGAYDSICAIIIFPLLVYLGASGKTVDKESSKICRFLGNIPHPSYIVHYPFMYLLYTWVQSKELNFSQAWPMALVVFFGNILLAHLCLKFYDEPARRWLTKKFPAKK